VTSTSSRLTVLDCTLRDGGYYNDWDFKPKLVSSYLKAVGAAHVDVVEIGFRSTPSGQFCGPYAYSTDEFLAKLPFSKDIAVCVMADAKDVIKAEQQQKNAVRRLFKPRNETPVSVVRIATHFSELSHCQGIVSSLKELGYTVGLNLMQSTQQPDAAITAAAAQVEAWKSVDVLYFADSLGDMVPAGVRKMMGLLQAKWTGPIGMHAHDNKGIALLNTLEAIDHGATWVDATMLGMGRGAGNTKTEHLLIELAARKHDRYDPRALFEVVLEDFSTLQAEYKWGTNLLYYLAAEYAIHPTYVQRMMGLNQASTSTVIDGLERLKALPSLSYNARQFEQAVGSSDVDAQGTCDASKVVGGRDVLLVAGGPGAVEHQQGIVDFIARKKDLFVINLNADARLPQDTISAYASCHPVRITAELDRLIASKKPLIAPLGAIPEKWAARLKAEGSVIDYGLRTGVTGFAFGEHGATLPSAYVALYAIAFANAGGAKRIYLAGFDGFPLGDPRQVEMVTLLKQYAESPGAIELVAVTPTAYPVIQSSIYDPRA
jgi:4-hydroxy 2-oxovalerate aldolase